MKTIKIVLLLLCIAAVASATSFTFDFNSLNPTFATPGKPVDDSSISSTLTALLQSSGCAGCTVTVSGAFVDTTYSGENHAVGNVNGSAVTPITLGTSDFANCNSTSKTDNCSNNAAMAVHAGGTTDSFLANTDNNGKQGKPASTGILMTFTGLTISSLGFDYEIFPDGGCQSKNNCSSGIPTFELKAGNNGLADVNGFGTNGIVTATFPGVNSSDGNSTHSANSSASSTETSSQYIGTWSGALGGANSNANQVDFIDWPATIGIDNLTLTYTRNPTTPTVPEPASVILLGTLAGGLVLRKKFKAV